MNFENWADAKIKKLSWVDLALIKLSCLTFGIMLVLLIPKLAKINVWWMVGVFILFAIKPLLKVFEK